MGLKSSLGVVLLLLLLFLGHVSVFCIKNIEVGGWWW